MCSDLSYGVRLATGLHRVAIYCHGLVRCRVHTLGNVGPIVSATLKCHAVIGPVDVRQIASEGPITNSSCWRKLS